MKLADLIQNHSWSKVRPVLLREYPDQAGSLEVYEHMYNVLQATSPAMSDLQIVFEDVADKEFGDYIDWCVRP